MYSVISKCVVRKGPPKYYKQIKKKYPELFNSYEQLSDIVQEAGPLETKHRHLSKLGIAIGMEHEHSIKSQIKKSLEFGAEPREILHVIFLSITMIGFSRMMAALSIAEEVFDDFELEY